MRWIDIDLQTPARCRAAAPRLTEAAARTAALPALVEQAGPDTPAITREMAAVGQLLFRAVTRADPRAFAPDAQGAGASDARIGVAEADGVLGYHLVARPDDLALPWNWLHNGLGFLLAQHPICAGPAGTWATFAQPNRPWLGRHREAALGELAGGAQPLPHLLSSLRPAEAGAARILFLAGHGDAEVWPLLYREAEAIDTALSGPLPANPLARLHVPAAAMTPGSLARARWSWQGFHFAGPTARPPAAPGEEPWQALQSAGWSAREGAPTAATDLAVSPQEELGELEYAGVDPISALLDELTARADASPPAPPPAPATANAGPVSSRRGPGRSRRPREQAPDQSRWLLEDGPLRPETLAAHAATPPLVFSNSYLSLPGLGPRFLAAGVSTFVGPVAPLRSGPAREFAARFYACLAEGWPAAAALRGAALACRELFGAEHPAWLSYGVVGHGSLALQYL